MTAMFQELSKSLKSAKGKLYALKSDVSKESDIQEAFKWVKANLGGVDILVNNAAAGKDTPLSSKSPQETAVILNMYFNAFLVGALLKKPLDVRPLDRFPASYGI
jgi:NAD(P)-dependent dehydrogenase (short-subunit alcohol dehydrogenase family)